MKPGRERNIKHVLVIIYTARKVDFLLSFFPLVNFKLFFRIV